MAADRIEVFERTVAAQSTDAFTFPLEQEYGVVERIDVRFADGHAGKVTAVITYADGQVIPAQLGDVLRGNRQTYTFPMDNLPIGNGWGMGSNNTDVWPHTIKVSFHIRDDDLDSNLPGADTPDVVLLPAVF